MNPIQGVGGIRSASGGCSDTDWVEFVFELHEPILAEYPDNGYSKIHACLKCVRENDSCAYTRYPVVVVEVRKMALA